MWYVRVDGVVSGPFPESHIRQMAKNPQPFHVCVVGGQTWVDPQSALKASGRSNLIPIIVAAVFVLAGLAVALNSLSGMFR